MYTLPKLDYDYAALEPAISRKIMELHHDKHHQTYVDKLNAALEEAADLKDKSIEDLLRDLDAVPEKIRTAVRNNGGGHYNHSLFWQIMAPADEPEVSGALAEGLKQKYGDFAKFQEAFATAAIGIFGSGWVWLLPDLSIVTTPNQDSPIMNGQPEPILGLDVWEHAYYLDYMNKRPDYIQAWWQVVNWPAVARRFDSK